MEKRAALERQIEIMKELKRRKLEQYSPYDKQASFHNDGLRFRVGLRHPRQLMWVNLGLLRRFAGQRVDSSVAAEVRG